MIHGRRYVQFNNLVIDTYDMVDRTDTDTSFKYTSHDKTFGHGNYAPFKRDYMFAEEGSVSMTLTLHTKKLPCDERPHYRKMAISELNKQGKLWAVQNGELIWAYAVVTSLGESVSWQRDLIVLNVDFRLPEGIWHKADMQKTFLRPYDVCGFMDCYDFMTLQPCAEQMKSDGDCCTECSSGKVEEHDAGCDCCYCDTLCKEMALCYNLDALQNAYGWCDDWAYQITYNCQKAQEFFGDAYVGQKFCEKEACSGVIAGILYANTDIPTSSFEITIHGHLYNPAITINDNTNIIKGDYEDENGILTIKSNGEVYWRKSDCCEDELQPASAWQIPDGNTYGWELKPGNNRLVINTNSCCGRACAYIGVDGYTL